MTTNTYTFNAGARTGVKYPSSIIASGDIPRIFSFGLNTDWIILPVRIFLTKLIQIRPITPQYYAHRQHVRTGVNKIVSDIDSHAIGDSVSFQQVQLLSYSWVTALFKIS